MSEIKKRVVTGLIVASLLAAASAAPDWIANISSSVYTYLTRWVSIPTWGLYVLVIISIKQIIYTLKSSVSSYNYDSFFSMNWMWWYFLNTSVGFKAYCLRCGIEILPIEDRRNNQIICKCDVCNIVLYQEEGSWSLLLNKVERQIDRKLRNGEWKKAVKK